MARPGSSWLEAQAENSSLRAATREGLYAAALVLAGASVLYICVLLPSRLKTDQLRTQRDALKTKKEALEKDVKDLVDEARSLETDHWAVERALRRRLGFLRPGESVLKG